MKDTQLFESVERELNRQRSNIELIASVTTSMLYSNEQIQIFSSGKLF